MPLHPDIAPDYANTNMSMYTESTDHYLVIVVERYSNGQGKERAEQEDNVVGDRLMLLWEESFRADGDSLPLSLAPMRQAHPGGICCMRTLARHPSYMSTLCSWLTYACDAKAFRKLCRMSTMLRSQLP